MIFNVKKVENDAKRLQPLSWHLQIIIKWVTHKKVYSLSGFHQFMCSSKILWGKITWKSSLLLPRIVIREQLSYKSTRAKKTMISYPWSVILRFDRGTSFFLLFTASPDLIMWWCSHHSPSSFSISQKCLRLQLCTKVVNCLAIQFLFPLVNWQQKRKRCCNAQVDMWKMCCHTFTIFCCSITPISLCVWSWFEDGSLHTECCCTMSNLRKICLAHGRDAAAAALR